MECYTIDPFFPPFFRCVRYDGLVQALIASPASPSWSLSLSLSSVHALSLSLSHVQMCVMCFMCFSFVCVFDDEGVCVKAALRGCVGVRFFVRGDILHSRHTVSTLDADCACHCGKEENVLREINKLIANTGALNVFWGRIFEHSSPSWLHAAPEQKRAPDFCLWVREVDGHIPTTHKHAHART